MSAPESLQRWCACSIALRISDTQDALDRHPGRTPHVLPILKLQCASSVAVSGRSVIRKLEAAAGSRPPGAVLSMLSLSPCPRCSSLEDDLRGARSLRPDLVPVWLSLRLPVNGHLNPVDWPNCDALAPTCRRGRA